MAADEYYDAVGETLSYILSAEDTIERQISNRSGIQFMINRRNRLLDFFAQPNKRYFTLNYYFHLSNEIANSYENNSELYQEHIEEYDIDESEHIDKNIYQYVATHRIKDIDDKEAKKVKTAINSFATHSDCRITPHHTEHPEKSDYEMWDGVTISGLLYPYESDFSPRDYEQTAQEVISVGNQIDEEMKKLDAINKIISDD